VAAAPIRFGDQEAAVAGEIVELGDARAVSTLIDNGGQGQAVVHEHDEGQRGIGQT